MRTPSDFRAPAAAAEPQPPAWLVPVLLYLPVAAWVGASAHLLSGEEGRALAGSLSPTFVTSFILALVAAGVLIETLGYRMLWAARGHHLPFARMALVNAQLTILEPIAATLMQRLPAGTTGAAYLAPWVGARALWEGGAPTAWAAAFGSLGVLALGRMALGAAVQAQLVRRPWGEAFVQVVAVWCASHVALAWLDALLRGVALPH